MTFAPNPQGARVVEYLVVLNYYLLLPTASGFRPNGPFFMPHRTDRELVDAARGGDAEAFGAIVRRHQKRIYRLALHLLRSAAEAEDVTQETFVRAYGALARFDGRSEPYTWIYRIAVNLSLNTIRARKTTRHSAPPDDPHVESLLLEVRGAGTSPADATQDRELAPALIDGLGDLSEDAAHHAQRWLGSTVCPTPKPARSLGCPEGTIAWRVHEARRKLLRLLPGGAWKARRGGHDRPSATIRDSC